MTIDILFSVTDSVCSSVISVASSSLPNQTSGQYSLYPQPTPPSQTKPAFSICHIHRLILPPKPNQRLVFVISIALSSLPTQTRGQYLSYPQPPPSFQRKPAISIRHIHSLLLPSKQNQRLVFVISIASPFLPKRTSNQYWSYPQPYPFPNQTNGQYWSYPQPYPPYQTKLPISQWSQIISAYL